MDLNGKKILIVKMRYIGDTLSIIPVVENLKEKAPRSLVDVLVNRGTEEVLAFHPDIEKLWVYDRRQAKKNIISSIRYHRKFIRNLRDQEYDFLIDFTHGDRAAFLSFVTGAPVRITYKDSSTLSRLLMNRVITSDPRKHHIVDYQLKSLKMLDLNHFNRHFRLHIPESVHLKIGRLLLKAGLVDTTPKVVIHPGARTGFRRWAPERFAEVARRIRENHKAAIVLLGGPGEADLVEKLEGHMGFPASLSSTGLSILEMAALLKHCQLFIGNDSAPGHIAAAVGCPNLTLFGPTFPNMWRPLSSVGEVVFKDVECCGCSQESCIRPEMSCMDLIEVKEVWEKVQKMMGQSSL